MRAARLHGPGDLRVEQVAEPSPSPKEVLVRPSIVGLCGTDLAVYSGRYATAMTPIVVGHEFVGSVAAVGSDERRWKVGDRVVAEASWRCGRCTSCEHGYRPCDRPVALGRTRDGCLAELVALPSRILYPATGVDERAQAFVSIATVLHAADLARADARTTTAVVGMGHAGLLLVQLLRGREVPIVAVGTRRNRLELALGCDVDDSFDVNEPSSKARLGARIADGGVGPIAVDATGTAEGFGLALGLTTAGGRIVVYSILGSPATVDNLDLIYRRGLTIVGSKGAGECYPRAAAMLATADLDPLALTGKPVSLDDAPELFQAVASKRVHEPRPLVRVS
jgi:threonine dehydrogenase-like Zn-dependent dehydrogenase